MALFVNVCFLVLLNFEMILLLKASYHYGIQISNEVSDAKVPVAEYSFVVLVNLTVKQTYCTGALISRTFVLIAAHCVNEETSTSARVYRGNLDEIFNGNVRKNTTNTTDRVIRKRYEEIQSVAIIRPWLYDDSVNRFDIALIQINSTINTSSFVKAALYTTTFAQSNPIINCKAVGYNVAAIPKQQERHRPSNKSSVRMLIEQTITFKRQCETTHETDGKCYSTSWIIQQDKQYVDPTFANSSVLLFCGDSTTHMNSLNGIALGKINVSSSGMSSKPDYPLVFEDICPYLSWIRHYVGPSVKRSPGSYGEGCFYSMSSIGTQKNSIMAWIVVIVCILLYL